MSKSHLCKESSLRQNIQSLIVCDVLAYRCSHFEISQADIGTRHWPSAGSTLKESDPDKMKLIRLRKTDTAKLQSGFYHFSVGFFLTTLSCCEILNKRNECDTVQEPGYRSWVLICSIKTNHCTETRWWFLFVCETAWVLCVLFHQRVSPAHLSVHPKPMLP